MKDIINIPITVQWSQTQDEVPARTFMKLVEFELYRPELNAKLQAVIEEAKAAALKSINSI